MTKSIRVYPYVETHLNRQGANTGEECLYIKIYWDDLTEEALENEVSFPLKDFDEAKLFLNKSTFKDAIRYMETFYNLPKNFLYIVENFERYGYEFEDITAIDKP